MSYDPKKGAMCEGVVSACLGPGNRYWRKDTGTGAKLSRGEGKIGRWERRGFDRKRNELSGRGKITRG